MSEGLGSGIRQGVSVSRLAWMARRGAPDTKPLRGYDCGHEPACLGDDGPGRLRRAALLCRAPGPNRNSAEPLGRRGEPGRNSVRLPLAHGRPHRCRARIRGIRAHQALWLAERQGHHRFGLRRTAPRFSLGWLQGEAALEGLEDIAASRVMDEAGLDDELEPPATPKPAPGS